MKPKILVITHSLPTKAHPIAGIFLLNQLGKLRKKCEIKVIFPYPFVPNFKLLNPYHKFSRFPRKSRMEGIEVYSPRFLSIPKPFFKMKFLNIYLFIESFFSYWGSKNCADKILRGWKPDIIHLHSLMGGEFLALDVKKKTKSPLISTIYGEDLNRFFDQLPSSILSKMTARNCELIVCQSKSMEKKVKEYKRFKGKTEVIPMGADISSVSFSRRQARKELSIPKNKKVILFTGYLVKRKGVDYLLKALQLLNQNNIVCYVIGDGILRANLENLAKELKLKNVNFLGQLSHDIHLKYLKASDIFVLPSLSEGLPVVICEALSCGIPVVSTKIDGVSEIVTKKSGFLATPADPKDLSKKILAALNKKWNVSDIKKRGRSFSVESSAEKIFESYKKLLS